MRPQQMPGAQPSMMPMYGATAATAQQQFIIPQQSAATENGKSNNVQLDPFGAF